jgi:predicted nucleic acid-binding protein
MNKILIDTMHIEAIFSKDNKYLKLIDAIDDGKIMGISSVVTLTELIKNMGKRDEKRMETAVRDIKSSEIILVDVTQEIAEEAGRLRLKYDVPTIDSIIAATSVIENIKHVLTNDKRHFGKVTKLKLIDIAEAEKLAR